FAAGFTMVDRERLPNGEPARAGPSVANWQTRCRIWPAKLSRNYSSDTDLEAIGLQLKELMPGMVLQRIPAAGLRSQLALRLTMLLAGLVAGCRVSPPVV